MPPFLIDLAALIFPDLRSRFCLSVPLVPMVLTTPEGAQRSEARRSRWGQVLGAR